MEKHNLRAKDTINAQRNSIYRGVLVRLLVETAMR